jgi:hypothetical protein
LPVVAIVVASRGLPALARFFSALPADTESAFVVVGGSGEVAPQVFGGRDVKRVTRRVSLVRGLVCLVPADAYVSLAENVVFPLPAALPGELPADHLLVALADECAERAIAVVLGELDRDGRAGVHAVDEAGGLVLANTASVDAARMEAPASELGGMVARQLATLQPPDVAMLAARIMAGRGALPAAVLVDRGGEILYVHGRTGDYLEPATGYANWNVVAMARPGLRDALDAALPSAFRSGKKAFRRGLAVQTDDGTKRVDLSVEPAGDFAMVIFGGRRR